MWLSLLLLLPSIAFHVQVEPLGLRLGPLDRHQQQPVREQVRCWERLEQEDLTVGQLLPGSPGVTAVCLKAGGDGDQPQDQEEALHVGARHTSLKPADFAGQDEVGGVESAAAAAAAPVCLALPSSDHRGRPGAVEEGDRFHLLLLDCGCAACLPACLPACLLSLSCSSLSSWTPVLPLRLLLPFLSPLLPLPSLDLIVLLVLLLDMSSGRLWRVLVVAARLPPCAAVEIPRDASQGGEGGEEGDQGSSLLAGDSGACRHDAAVPHALDRHRGTRGEDRLRRG
eukprot:392542-Hanusia_phi.AAC.2